MPNRPCARYDYSRPGVAMITLKAAPSVRLCHITQTSFALTEIGRVVQEALLAIQSFVPAFKLGHYQIMPDHVHFLAHVVAPLPEGGSLRDVVRAFKIDVSRRVGRRVFEAGLYDSLVFDRRQLDAEVAYIRDNVRRLRLRQANPGYFREVRELPAVAGCRHDLVGFGNPALLTHPRRVAIRVSDRAGADAWREVQSDVEAWLAQGFVFVSPFISRRELAVRDAVLAGQGRLIRITHEPFGERHKPAGPLFDACCAGRVLEISAAREFPPDTGRITRPICLRLNEIAAALAGPAPKGLGAGRGGEPAGKGLGAGRGGEPAGKGLPAGRGGEPAGKGLPAGRE
jgi:hypothetical protein